MPKNSQIDPRNSFVLRYLPWLLGGVMFVVYAVTLNHWITLSNLYQVAEISGWTWQPQIVDPLSFFVTLPFHLVPVASVPMAINLFSAFCAAATLAILARSVAILPHDRTELQRLRERSDFSFLTGWVAWVPPITAITFAGFQLAYWENATSFTNESFDLLWFAIILWQMLEYRLDEREGRLFAAALMFGAGLSENWGMLGYSPIFLMTLIWLRGLSFFNANFLSRVIFYGLAGLLMFLFLPVLARLLGNYPVTIWEALKPNLRQNWLVLRMVNVAEVRHGLALMSLTSLLPAFLMALRWSSSYGDSSRMGTALVQYMMHIVNAVVLGVMVWLAFDPPFSPHALLQQMGLPAMGMTLYYIVALCIGYYGGYFLLVFGKSPVPSRRSPRPEPALPGGLAWLCPAIAFGTISFLFIGAGLLIYKNGPEVRSANDDSLLKFAKFTTQQLPHERAILFCDSDDPKQDQPIRTYLIQAELAREGRTQAYPVVDTAALNWVPYHAYLHKHYPSLWPQTVATNEVGSVSGLTIYTLLGQLSKSNTLCYLNPSFGYYFEQFYQEPHGLDYVLRPLPEKTFLPPRLDANLIAENETFWTQVLDNVRPSLDKELNPVDWTKQTGAIAWCMAHLHVKSDPNPNAVLAGAYYSRGLNSIGVGFQRAGELEKAATFFQSAQILNSNNVVAGVNLAFNKTLREGAPATVDLTRASSDQFGKYHNWNEVLDANGPFDETSFSFMYGVWLMNAGLLHQAVASFDRVRQLVPDNLAARLFLGQIYLMCRQPNSTLEVLNDPLTRPFRFGLTEYNTTELSVLASAAHLQKNDDAPAVALLETEMNRHPDDEMLLLVSAQVFNMRGLYTNALRVIDRKLERTPDDPTWVFGKGYVSLQVGDYAGAITNLSRILKVQTNNPSALYNRGVAYFQSGRLDEARSDFLRFQALYTNNLQIAYGLGEIAWRQHDTNEAIRNYRVILANAPTNLPDLKAVRERLSQLDGK